MVMKRFGGDKTATNISASVRGVSSALQATKDALVSVSLDDIRPDPKNYRFGPRYLDFESVYAVVRACAEQPDQDELPSAETLTLFAADNDLDAPFLNDTGAEFYDSLVELAYAIRGSDNQPEQPIKLFPQDGGAYLIKFGHRRYYALRLLGVGSTEALIDRTSTSEIDALYIARSRLIENDSREDQTLAEDIVAMGDILVAYTEKHAAKPKAARLARELGMERTRVGRMMAICESGFATHDNGQLLERLHCSDIGDITSVALLVQEPSESWSRLLTLLEDVGPDRFRARLQKSDQSNTPKQAGRKSISRITLKEKHQPGVCQVVRLLSEAAPDLASSLELPADDPVAALQLIIERLSEEGVSA